MPASRPLPMASRLSEVSTSWPRPPAPIIEAMMTMLRDSMMTWLTPDHQGRPGRRHHHLPQQLAARCSRPCGRTRRPRSGPPQGQHGAADHGRHGIDDGRDHRRHRAEAEQEQDRHQIGEDRHRLHEIEDRRDDRSNRRAVPQMPSSRPPHDAQRHRDDDRGQGHHGAVPLAEDHQVEETGADQQAASRQPSRPGAQHDDHHHGDPGDPAGGVTHLARRIAPNTSSKPEASRPLAAVQERLVEQPGDGAGQLLEGEQAEIGLVDQPLHEVADPEAQRHDCQPADSRPPRARVHRRSDKAMP